MHKWTAEQIDILITNFPTLGATKVHRLFLSNISIPTIRTKARSLGLINKEYNWTKEEVEALSCFCMEHTTDELMELFPGRTRQSIKLKLLRLGLSCLPSKSGGSLIDGKPTTLYLINFGEYYKVGITQQSLKQRLKSYPPYKVEWVLEGLDLEKAKELEIDILEQVDLFSPEGWTSGRTECFKADKVPTIPDNRL